MKIAQIVPSLEARHGGPSRSVRGVADGLARCGHAVELLTTGPLDGVPPAGGALTISAFPRQWPSSIARSDALGLHLSAQRYDVIHSHGLWQRTLHYARGAAENGDTPLVISPRGMMTPWAWNHRRTKKLIASWLVHPGAFTTAAGWHATSEAEVADIRRLGFTQPICMAPNGVVPPSAAEETAAAAHWHALLPALAGRRVALFYSRFHSKKRVLELIDLWLSKPRGDWLLLLVGIPEQYTVSHLEAHIKAQGGAGKVLVQDGAGQPPPYAAASLFVLPSHSENFGLVVVEALVHGVPVLTTDTTPWQELAPNGAGQCVAWAAFGSALDTLLAETPAALHASGGRARAWAGATFSWDRAAKILDEFYAQLTSKR